MDRDKNVIINEANKLGVPASHGCIRLEIENAKWIYYNIPIGTPVNIHK
jgi:lipoprotein-anchoring transpeptidase ErfK/SrfK